MTTQNGEQNRDLAGRNDVARLVDEFYARLRGDEVLGPIFDDIAQVDWPTHLPRMYDFWDTVLFGTATFRGDPLGVHRTLAQRAPLTKQTFDRWVGLFQATVDDLFVGPAAEYAKYRAVRIAEALHHHVAAEP